MRRKFEDTNKEDGKESKMDGEREMERWMYKRTDSTVECNIYLYMCTI